MDDILKYVELKKIGTGSSIDTDAYYAHWNHGLRELVKDGLVKQTKLNSRQTRLTLTAKGGDELERLRGQS